MTADATAAHDHHDRHVVVVAAPGALPDPGAALEVFDGALATWGLTGEIVLAASSDEVRDTVSWAAASGREPVVVPGPAADLPTDLARPADDDAPDRPTVLRLDLADRPRDPSRHVRRHVRGRGLDGLRHVVDAWRLHRTHPPDVVHSYGTDPDQHADLRLPASAPTGPGGHGVAVLVHGGYWRSRWESDLMEPIAADLVDRGWATWNVEYRRPDDQGWDATTHDVAAALAALADVAAPPGMTALLDLTRVVVLGHSAGGQLVTRLAADTAADAAVDHDVPVRPALTVALAGVLDLVDGDRRHLGGGAVADALGGPAHDLPDVYRAASPIARVPIASPLAVVCGLEDELLGQSRAFAEAARQAGDDVVLVEGPGDHFAVVDPRSSIWCATVRRIEERVPR